MLEVLYTYRATIYRVIDGDTFHATIDLGFRMFAREIIRVRDLNTPEIKRYKGVTAAEVAHGLKAKEYAERLLPVGSVVTLRTYKADPAAYARWEADVQMAEDAKIYAAEDFAAVMKFVGMAKKAKYGIKKN